MYRTKRQLNYMPEKPNPFIMRDYQRASITAIYEHFETHSGNPLIVIPTGGGKSPCMATFIREAIEKWDDIKILQLVHVRELVKQNYETMMRVMPHCDATICSASLNQKNISGQVVFASIQSIYKKGFELGKIDLVIVDEAHLIPHKTEGMYRKLINDMQMSNPYMKIIGYTATPYRTTSGRLDRGVGRVFDRVAYEVNISDLILEGYLSPLVTKGTKTEIDLSDVKTRAGEFVSRDLSNAIDRESITISAVNEIVAYGRDRRAWIVFGVSISHAEHIRDVIRSHGISCEAVHSKITTLERERIIKAFKAGKIRCIANCDVLTTGFDAPNVDLLAVIRPTQSPGLWVQIAGRGTRLAEGKKDCLVLDFGGNTMRHGPIDRIRGSEKEFSNTKGDAPVKQCPECNSMIHISVMECQDCGYIFPEPPPKINPEADNLPVLSGSVKPEKIEVDSVSYSRHRKMGKPDSVRVSYMCGLRQFNEWVCVEHEGYAGRKAIIWLKRHFFNEPNHNLPSTTDEALKELPLSTHATHITIKPDGKYTQILKAHYDY